MIQKPFVIAILSGKGGVGKTTISLNLARELSARGPVWLIDIDLFNRGATSALWESEKQIPLSVAELVLDAQRSPEIRESPEGLRVAFVGKLSGVRTALAYDGCLTFVPAARAAEGREASYVLWRGLAQRGVSSEAFIEALADACAELTQGGVVILDGHGGLDELSLAAALVSDTTYIVNEADLVTFTGSVTLYREILEQARNSPHEPWIEFIINRVSPRQTIENVEAQFGPMLDAMSPSSEAVAMYFPLEPELFGVFGDDPFVSELYTQYWFSRKIRFLADRIADAGIAAGVLSADRWTRPARRPAETPFVRTALSRELHKRGDVILIGWLGIIVVLLIGWVWELLKLTDTVSTGMPIILWFVSLATAIVFVGVTVGWIRVQREHLKNVRELRGKPGRRLRFGDTASARRRDEVETAAKTQRAGRPLRTAAIVLAVLGGLAVLIVPRMLDALQRSKQKKTMSDLRYVATALEARATDMNEYVSAGPNHTVAEIAGFLQPTYAKTVPTIDAWKKPLRYYAWGPDSSGNVEYAFVSPGRDGAQTYDDPQKYPIATTTSFDCDIVFANGSFIMYPEGIQGQ